MTEQPSAKRQRIDSVDRLTKSERLIYETQRYLQQRSSIESNKQKFGKECWSSSFGSKTEALDSMRRGFLELAGLQAAGGCQDLQKIQMGTIAPTVYPKPHEQVFDYHWTPKQDLRAFQTVRGDGNMVRVVCAISRHRYVNQCPLAMLDAFLIIKHQLLGHPLCRIQDKDRKWTKDYLLYDTWPQEDYQSQIIPKLGTELNDTENTPPRAGVKQMVRENECSSTGARKYKYQSVTPQLRYETIVGPQELVDFAGFPDRSSFFLYRDLIDPWKIKWMEPLLWGLFPGLKEAKQYVMSFKNEKEDDFISCKKGLVLHYEELIRRFYQDMPELMEQYPGSIIHNHIPLFQNERMNYLKNRWILLQTHVVKSYKGAQEDLQSAGKLLDPLKQMESLSKIIYESDCDANFVEIIDSFWDKTLRPHSLIQLNLSRILNEVPPSIKECYEKLLAAPESEKLNKLGELVIYLCYFFQPNQFQHVNKSTSSLPEEPKTMLAEHTLKKSQESQKIAEKILKNNKELKRKKDLLEQLGKPDYPIDAPHAKVWKEFQSIYPEENMQTIWPAVDDDSPWNQWCGIPQVRYFNNGGQSCKEATMTPSDAWKAWCCGITFQTAKGPARTPPMCLLEYTRSNFLQMGLSTNDPHPKWRLSTNEDKFRVNKQVMMIKKVVYYIDNYIHNNNDDITLKEKLEQAIESLKQYKKPLGDFKVSSIARYIKDLSPSVYEKQVLGWGT